MNTNSNMREPGQAIGQGGALVGLKRQRDSKDSSKSASRQPLVMSLRKKREKGDSGEFEHCFHAMPRGETASVRCRTPGPDARERNSELAIHRGALFSQEPTGQPGVVVGLWEAESHVWSGV